MSRLYTEGLTLAYENKIVVEDLSLRIPEGKVTALIGANGSGKSTTLRALARVLKPLGGAAYLDGKAIHTQPTKQIARVLAALPQNPEAPAGLTVRELVSYGRFPYQQGFGLQSAKDRQLIAWALKVTGLTAMADRAVGTLSGGQRQRAWIAMALAQDTPILLLDEPTTFLDMGYQLEVLQLLARLNQEEGRTVAMVLHDLNHAARYAHYIVAIARGRVVASGEPAEVITPEVLRRVFGIEADVIVDPRSGTPLCIPHSLCPDHGQSF